MFRYKLRTLLIAVAIMPPLLAGAWCLRSTEGGWRATAASAGGALVVRVLLGSPNRGKSFLMLIAG